MNRVHLEVTGPSNERLGSRNLQLHIYETNRTSSYLQVRCIHRKCRFMLWYKYKQSAAQTVVDIEHFRSINLNHDILVHQEANTF